MTNLHVAVLLRCHLLKNKTHPDYYFFVCLFFTQTNQKIKREELTFARDCSFSVQNSINQCSCFNFVPAHVVSLL